MKCKLAWVLLPAALLLAGCGERYRYPCQNPENWDQKMCQKPFCTANGTCPEDLRHYEKGGTGPTPSLSGRPVPEIKGDNKC